MLDDFNLDGASDTLVVHHRLGRQGQAPPGTFDIYVAPDDDTEFNFKGAIANGNAKMDVIVGGTFTEPRASRISRPLPVRQLGRGLQGESSLSPASRIAEADRA